MFALAKRPPIHLRLKTNRCGGHLWRLFSGVEFVRVSFWLFVKGITVQATPLLPMAGYYYRLPGRVSVFIRPRGVGRARSRHDHDAGAVFRRGRPGRHRHRRPAVADCG